MSRRRIAIAAGLLGLALVVLLYLLRRGGDANAHAAAVPGSPGATTAQASAQPALPPLATRAAVPGAAQGPTEKQVRDFRDFRVKALKQAARYPGDSGPLTERHFDALLKVFADNGAVTADDEPDPNADGRQVQLFAYAAKPHFQIDEPAVLFAEVRNLANETRMPAKITAQMKKLIGGTNHDAFGTLTYRDDGQGGDSIAGDLVYTAVVTATSAPREMLDGQIDLEVSATLADGRARFVLSVFRMGSPGAHLTGTFKDHLQDGHLMLDCGVVIDKPGRYHLQGGLVGANGELVAWSQNAVHFDALGPATMSLRFYGLAFHDANVPGPYKLAFVSIAETERRPVLQGPVLRDAYTTAAYKVSDFSDQPNNDPAMEETIRQAEAIKNMPLGPDVIPASR